MSWCRSKPWRRRQWEHLYDEEQDGQHERAPHFKRQWQARRWSHWYGPEHHHARRPLRYRQRLERLPERGVIAGVCAGVADHLQVAPNALRVLCVVGAIGCGIVPMVILYIVLYMVLPCRQLKTTGVGGEAAGDHPPSFSDWQRRKLRRDLQAIDARTRRVESYLISSEYEWERKYRDLSE